MEKVLVTGGCGFIGSHIAEQLLKENYRVSILDNLTTGHRSNIEGLAVDFYEQDITKPEVIDVIKSIDPDYIIHLAAQVSVAESVSDFLNDENINIKGSLHIIKAAGECSVKRLSLHHQQLFMEILNICLSTLVIKQIQAHPTG